jgi:predicted transcriptional regulator
MIISEQRITIIRMRKPAKPDMNSELQWFGNALGLRDKDKSQFRLFIELLKAAKNKTPINSDGLAYKLGLTRGTVVHHLNKLIEAGIVVPTAKGYLLRVSNLTELIDEIERDIKDACSDLRDIAKDIDERLK